MVWGLKIALPKKSAARVRGLGCAGMRARSEAVKPQRFALAISDGLCNEAKHRNLLGSQDSIKTVMVAVKVVWMVYLH